MSSCCKMKIPYVQQGLDLMTKAAKDTVPGLQDLVLFRSYVACQYFQHS